MAVNPTGGPRGAEHDDPESADAADAGAPAGGTTGAGDRLDLTPSTARHAGRGRRGRSRSLLAVGVVVLVLFGLGVVLFNGLNDASTFFYNVDEALDRRDELDGDRFRMQGNVVDGSVEPTDDGVSFTLSYAGRQVDVAHVGDPPELFGPDIPVVLEGSFADDGFASDAILIRHDSSYDEEHPRRIREAERDAEGDARPAGDGGSGG